MSTKLRRVALEKLKPHPDNPNRMSRGDFAKLVRNIKRTGRYEPIVVRPHPNERGCFQIINGHHRCRALEQLDHTTAQVVVWNVDDEQTDLLLLSLNRLHGRDLLEKKLAVLRRLSGRMASRDLARLVPQTRGQLERLIGLKPLSRTLTRQAEAFAVPVVFFVSKDQQQAIEDALSLADGAETTATRSARRAAALTRIADDFVNRTLEEPSKP
jgi:ParB/RepB/Spo0J family partition protein